ncbi:MAG TPA: MFS transporter [Motilibacteraceae bacterium]|nr:MFS transporter [Motilibacteraceae bacterium]
MPFTWPMPSTPSLWRLRDLRVVVVARALCLLGDEAAVVALVLRTHDRGEGGWVVAALFAAAALPAALFAPWVGRLVDTRSSRQLLVTAGLVQAVLCCGLSVVSAPAGVLVLVALLGLGQAVTAVTWQALLPHIVGPDRLASALGLSQATATGAAVLAPVLAGLLVGTVGAAPVLLLDAATFLALTAAGLLVRTMRRPDVVAPGQVQPKGRARDGALFLSQDKVVAPLVAALLAFVLLAGSVNVVEVFLVRDSYGASSTWYGLLGAVFAVGLVLGSALAGRCRGSLSLVRADLAGVAALAAGLVLFGLVPGVVLALPAALLAGTGNGAVNVATGALVLGRAPDALRGRVGAALGGSTNAAMLASLALGGGLAAVLDPRAVFLLGGGAALLVVALAAPPVLRAVRRELSSYQPSEIVPAPAPSPA